MAPVLTLRSATAMPLSPPARFALMATRSASTTAMPIPMPIFFFMTPLRPKAPRSELAELASGGAGEIGSRDQIVDHGLDFVGERQSEIRFGRGRVEDRARPDSEFLLREPQVFARARHVLARHAQSFLRLVHRVDELPDLAHRVELGLLAGVFGRARVGARLGDVGVVRVPIPD